MEFITDPQLSHKIFKDVVRINYQVDMPSQTLNDCGTCFMIFVYGNSTCTNYEGKEMEVPRFFIKGSGDFFKVKGAANSSLLAFEMPNYFFSNITGLNATDSRNKFYEMSDFLPTEVVSSLIKEMEGEGTIDGMVKLIDKYLSPFYENWVQKPESVEIVDYIFEKKGLINKSDLLTIFPHSSKTLDRLFNKEVGVSPHQFIKLIRFNFVLRLIAEDSSRCTLDIIQQYDYFDQSHLEKDFQKFMGQSIYEYRNEDNPLLTSALEIDFSR
ncbi:MAG: helix-turn-helix domain-containing protein [Flavobacteriales bacterium]